VIVRGLGKGAEPAVVDAVAATVVGHVVSYDIEHEIHVSSMQRRREGH